MRYLPETGEFFRGDVRADNVRTDGRYRVIWDADQKQKLAHRAAFAYMGVEIPKGVHWDKARGKYRTAIRINGKVVSLGRFDVLEDAIKAVCAAREKHHKEFAREV